MKTRISLTLMLLLMGKLAFAQKSVPTCNGFDSTGVIPVYFAPTSTTGTTLCTDYFGKANYANSPLPAGPVDVSATGFTIVNGAAGIPRRPPSPSPMRLVPPLPRERLVPPA
jgi:hypothetical protein